MLKFRVEVYLSVFKKPIFNVILQLNVSLVFFPHLHAFAEKYERINTIGVQFAMNITVSGHVIKPTQTIGLVVPLTLGSVCRSAGDKLFVNGKQKNPWG